LKGRGTYFRNGVEVPKGKFYIDGEAIELSAESINKIAGWNTVTALDGSEGQKACVTNGVTAITGGEGIADMTLAAPSPGDRATIRINTITSGSVVVTCATGVTLDGTNKKATFDAAGEALVLAYKSPTQWQIVLNIGGVALSA
jgi:uncharacterized protein with ACT and thioredoxin-like domain